MKTERRHELQTNELADWIGTKTKQIRPYSKLIVGVVVLVLAAVFLLSFGAAQRQRTREAAWTKLFALQADANSTFDPVMQSRYVDQLVDLARQHAGSPVSAWALQTAGDINLALGADLLWRDRDEARAKFNLALESYSDALAASKYDMLRQRSLLGLAQANEALNKLADAKDIYQQITKEWEGTSLEKTAAKRLAFLQLPSTLEFYDWFVRQQPFQPPLTSGVPDQGPRDELPFSSNLLLPNPDDLTRPDSTVAPFPVVAPESSSQPAGNDSGAADVGRGGDFKIAPTAPTEEATPEEASAADGGVDEEAAENAEAVDEPAGDNGK